LTTGKALPRPKNACDKSTVTDLKKILDDLDGLSGLDLVEAIAVCASFIGKWIIKMPEHYS
jgi:hypothetical protein